jgi:hypothetical protein
VRVPELPPPLADDLRPETPSALPAVAAAPNWYPDPHDPARERWWDGETWTDATHRRVRTNLYGDAYTRSLWAGANRAARIAQLFNLGALLVLIVGLILTVAALADGGSKVLPLVLSFIGLALAGVGLRFAIVALGRAPRLGAKGLAVYQLVSASISLLLGVIAVTLGLAP